MIPGLGNETSVLQWVQGLRPDPSRMLEMRRLLAAELGSAGLFLMSDQMVLRQIARLAAADKIHLHYPAELTETIPEGASTAPAKSAPPPRVPRPRAPAAAPFREPPVDSPTFSTDVDMQAQAATLMAAASSGKPFCPE
jgi:hypothetical protein